MKHHLISVAALVVLIPALARPSLAQPQASPPQPAPGAAAPAPSAPGAGASEAAAPGAGAPEAAAPGTGAPARQVSIGELLAVAVRQEPSLARATIDVRIAEAAVLEATGIDDWLLAVTGTWSSSREQQLDPTTGQYFDYSSNVLGLGADLTRSLSTGGIVGLNAGTSYTRASITDEASSVTHRDTVTAFIRQPLWQGRGSAVARAGVEQARLSRDAAELEREGVALDAVQQIVVAHWNLALAWRSLEIRRGSLALAQEQLRSTQLRIKAGAVAPTEALAVQQTIARREEEILNAELAVTEQSLTLRRLTGMEVGPGDVDLMVNASLAVAPQQFDTNALLSHALAHNPTLAALQVRESSQEVAVRLAEDALDPELDLEASISPTGIDDTASGALSNLVTLDALTFRAGLTYRQALGKRAVRGRHVREQELLYRQRVSVAEARAVLARDLVRAIKQAEIAQKRAEIGQQVIDLAAQNIEAEKARFTLGRATNFDVLQRQEELQQAQLTQALAIGDYLRAVATIDALTGDLLARYGITLDPAAEIQPQP